MIAGCPTDERLIGCLYRSYPEFFYFAGAIALGLFLVWRRWAPVLLGFVCVGLFALLKAWGLLP